MLEKTEEPKRVMVIGAGPAGLEAARVASLCGHSVTLFEATDRIGGQLTAAATPQFKSQLRALIEYYEVQLEKLHVAIHLNARVTPDDPALAQYDRWIVATGANPFTPPIPGMNSENVISVLDAHRNKSLVKGEHIVICGGGLSGCDCALELAMEHGKKPVIIEMLDQLAPNMIMMNRASMNRMLKEQQVAVYTGCRVESVDGTSVHILHKDGQQEILRGDTVISAFGMRPDNALATALTERFGWKVRAIGDCNQIGRVGLAVREGYFAGSTLDD